MKEMPRMPSPEKTDEKKEASRAKVTKILEETLSGTYAGETGPKQDRANGFADGYMRALIDLEAMSASELIELVKDLKEKARAEAQKSRPRSLRN
jgi:hypothetical protein